MIRRTRIVATLGPATDAPGILDAILAAGVDVVRINFSHGVAQEHRSRIRQFRESAARLGKIVAVLADLPGPKLRAKLLAPRLLTVGDSLAFSRFAEPKHVDDIVLTEPELLAEVAPEQRILLDDGRLQAVVVRTEADRVVARVTVGGNLLPNKGINLPDTRLGISAITPRDHEALQIAAEMQVDWLAMSFVRSAEAADELRQAARAVGLDAPVMAKIERPESVEHAAKIVHAFDAIMVARGDLGVEIPLEQVPTVQKRLIALARASGKPVVTATDMLDSMRGNPRPTRAEASDVANAIYDGTDAVMLSGETAAGAYPVEAVQAMNRIVCEADAHWATFGRKISTRWYDTDESIENALTAQACELAHEIRAAAIVMPTYTGRTARLLARHRPETKLIAPGPYEAVQRRLALVWGMTPVPMPILPPGADRIAEAVRAAFQAQAIEIGQRVVVLAGHPIKGGSRFPTLRVVRVGADGASEEP